MKDNFNELSRRYQEQMMKLYECRPKPPAPPEPPRPMPPRPQPPKPEPRAIFTDAPVAENNDNTIIQPENIPQPIEEPLLDIPDNDNLPSDTAYDTPAGTQEFSEETEYSEEIPEENYDTLDENHLEDNPELNDDDFPEIPSYIQPVPPVFPDEWTAQEDYEQRNTAEGMLSVIASTADSAFPVPDARVTVYTRIGGKLHLNYMMTKK
mgnify:CR=1 FL=1